MDGWDRLLATPPAGESKPELLKRTTDTLRGSNATTHRHTALQVGLVTVVL